MKLRNLFRGSLFIALALIVSITLTGCDMGQIADFIGKIGEIFTKVGGALQSFCSNLKSQNAATASGTAAVNTGATAPTTTPTTTTTPATTPTTTATSTEAKVGSSEATSAADSPDK